MKTAAAASTIFALFSTLSLATALPSLKSRDYGYGTIEVTLLGATNNPQQEYSVTVDICPDDSYPPTYTAPYDPDSLSISYVEYDHTVATCYFEGVDDSNNAPPVEQVLDSYNGQLGPPQTIVAITCVAVY